ncbi:MAG: hypothetical protein KAS12_04460 [Candidatus Aenigmarchaeota archaeon]|nr:hypothetical protein [Candidatus Aenigmarchaeota archaeon]
MSLENVSEEIIAVARKNSEKTENEGRFEAKKILSDAKKTVEELKKKQAFERKIAIEALDKKSNASSKILSNRIMLDAKKEIIEKTNNEIKSRILTITDADRKKLFDALLKKAMKQMPEAKKVYVCKKDEAYAKKVVKGMKVIVRDITGGVILENADGTVMIDNTFDMVLENTRRETIKEVSKILFS